MTLWEESTQMVPNISVDPILVVIIIFSSISAGVAKHNDVARNAFLFIVVAAFIPLVFVPAARAGISAQAGCDTTLESCRAEGLIPFILDALLVLLVISAFFLVGTAMGSLIGKYKARHKTVGHKRHNLFHRNPRRI